jgi:hypothetical protein
MFAATAQHQLTGIVKDAADESPIQYVTVALLLSDSSVITGVITGNDGKFIINNVAMGSYLLQISFIGYQKEYRQLNVPTQSDLGNIILTASATQMQEIVVTATRPLVVNRADRYIVNVSGNIQSAGRNALDIIRNTPGLLVSQKGDISMMGNNVQVWIDGRPSRISGEQLTAFLNSMQGGEIDRIEVVTNPSSRYDAAGGGGIIDIRTRSGLQFGTNGTLIAGYQQGRTDRENAGVSLNWRRKTFNAFGNYSINRNNSWEEIGQTNTMKTDAGAITFDQKAIAKSTSAGMRHSVRTGADFFLNPKNTLGFIVNAYHSDGGNASIKGKTTIMPALNGVSYSKAANVQSRTGSGIQLNANYQTMFSKPGQQLNIDFDYARFNSEPFQQNKNFYYDLNNSQIGDPEQLRNSNPQFIDVYSGKLDYVQPLWKNARLETGAKISQSKTDNDLHFDVFQDGNWQIDANRTNRFVYTEQIDAAYANISQRLGKFNLQAGLRGEYTSMKSEQKTTGEKNDTTYFNLFPTFFVSYQASQKHNIGISYSRRLSRPSYYELNPFEVAIDAYSFSRGNPYLRPSYTHNVQLSHTLAQSLMTRISYSHTTDLIMLVPFVDEDTQRYGSTRGNFGKSQAFSAMMNYRKPLLKQWMINLTVQGAYAVGTSNEASGKFTNKGSSLVVQLNNNIVLTPTLSAEITGMYMSEMRMGYLVIKPQGNLSAGLRKQLMNNKMTLSLTVNDILFTSKERGYARYENVNYSVYNARDSRYINLTLRYNFGSTTVRAARNKTTGIEEEATRAGGR